MPELPEVEVTRLSLTHRIEGARVRAARLGKPLRWPLGVTPDSLRGAVVGPLLRRGKYLWMPLQQGAEQGAGGLLLHLGMSGSLRFEPTLPPPGPHDHFELETDRGTLRLTDPRRFGAVVWSPGLDRAPAATLLARLGVEPLERAFSASVLHEALRGRRVAIKQALLAGDVVVGVGNIYCSEALFEAGIDPETPAQQLGPERCERLFRAVQDVLRRALAAGGSTLRDFRDAHGMGGAFQSQASVYDRAGLPCLRCTTPIRRIVQGQRATYFCPVCQRR
ncbi:bifunctional DNA-formamidopyrimidine glycosylase/DNA-(apurinic or apyrimidinic site) lyase [Sphaerotilus sp.]|uniref:bifunctional DNA-formamidopyrimidine glycosylase/DNA-(apurinic or apyrimidinic site) lyase n=1 Tax=Sphaerotilus sp. TaxID=2093942 RepID=UPI002ACE310A|nr:bifunctional DNA-formamidopyrimidine glycosylase/DNA-(apurinic or apyrimidinic site) lyase [Sphaerotilus sp.]MDZ7857492.1 bifunctional DNA-formamidopyrimidine glycosylase/DNA-(apurinic or apyrimidinic site) lyase [Sphaerotilus sp.]